MSIENVTLAALERDPFNERNIKMCQMYVSRFSDMMRRNCWLLLWGNVGTGKSYAATGIANGVIQNGFSAEMLTFEDLLNHSREGDEELNAIGADLVIIDDLAPIPASRFDLERIHTFLQSRHREGKPMIFTSRLTLSEMRSALDELGGKVLDFILTVCYPMQFTGKPRTFDKGEMSCGQSRGQSCGKFAEIHTIRLTALCFVKRRRFLRLSFLRK